MAREYVFRSSWKYPHARLSKWFAALALQPAGEHSSRRLTLSCTVQSLVLMTLNADNGVPMSHHAEFVDATPTNAKAEAV